MIHGIPFLSFNEMGRKEQYAELRKKLEENRKTKQFSVGLSTEI